MTLEAARKARTSPMTLEAARRVRPSIAADVRASTAPALAEDTQEILRHWREAVPHDRLAHLVKDATRAFVRALQVRLARHNIAFGHWAFLRILWEEDGITQKALSVQAGVMEPTTFSAVVAMEKLGYVERRRRPDNRKNVYVHLTRRGRALKRKLVPLAEEVNAIGVRGVPIHDIATVRAVLLAIIANLARDAMGEALTPVPTRRARRA